MFFCFFVISTFVVVKEGVVNTLNQSIYLSIYLPTNNLPTNLSIRSYGPSFLKAVLSAETVAFIKTVYREIQIQTKALYKLYWVV